MFEDMLVQRSELRDRMKDETNAKVRGVILESISAINKAFGEASETEDALVDEWERELAEGKIPDLERKATGVKQQQRSN